MTGSKEFVMRKMRNVMLAGAGLLLATGMMSAMGPAAIAAETAVRIPAPAVDVPATPKMETAVFAGGCFWGVQGVFSHVKGVASAVSGYAGGAKGTADYETVSTGTTGHAESVKIVYDPRVVSYGKLLQIYFSVVADPTMLNAQGPDHGTQYRSAIFPLTPQQKMVAERYIAQLGKTGAWNGPIVTKIEKLPAFYPAEGYHQDFLARKPDYPYIVINDLPKVEALKAMFPAQYSNRPVLVASR
jgi:peptide-methionine (S)-S-oxide reductase